MSNIMSKSKSSKDGTVFTAAGGTVTVELTILETPVGNLKKKSSNLEFTGCFIKNDVNLHYFINKSVTPNFDRNIFNAQKPKYLFYSPLLHLSLFPGDVTRAVLNYIEISKDERSMKPKTCRLENNPLVFIFDGHLFLCCDSEDLNKSKFMDKYSKEYGINPTLDFSKTFYGLGMENDLLKFISFEMHQPKSGTYNCNRTDFNKLQVAGPLLLGNNKTVVGYYSKGKKNCRIEIYLFEKSRVHSPPANPPEGEPQLASSSANPPEGDPPPDPLQPNPLEGDPPPDPLRPNPSGDPPPDTLEPNPPEGEPQLASSSANPPEADPPPDPLQPNPPEDHLPPDHLQPNSPEGNPPLDPLPPYPPEADPPPDPLQPNPPEDHPPPDHLQPNSPEGDPPPDPLQPNPPEDHPPPNHLQPNSPEGDPPPDPLQPNPPEDHPPPNHLQPNSPEGDPPPDPLQPNPPEGDIQQPDEPDDPDGIPFGVEQQPMFLRDFFEKDAENITALSRYLDRRSLVIKNYEDLANHLNAPPLIIAKCKSNFEHSPTLDLMQLEKVSTLSVYALVEKLKEFSRNDVVNEIKETIPENERECLSVKDALIRHEELFEQVAATLDTAKMNNWKTLGHNLGIDKDEVEQIGLGSNPTERLLVDYVYQAMEAEELTVARFRDLIKKIERRSILILLRESGITEQDDYRSIKDVIPPDSEIMWTLCLELNKEVGGLKNWKHLASSWGIKYEIYSQFKPNLKTSPTEILLKEWLIGERPTFTVNALCRLLGEIKRNDAKEFLEGKLQEYS